MAQPTSPGAILFAALALGIAGCVTLAPEAASLKVTRNAGDAEGCKIVGAVEAHPPYVGPNDGVNQMRNRAAVLGGNVLFVTSYNNVTATGVSYHYDDP